jgi:hypothetical protein
MFGVRLGSQPPRLIGIAPGATSARPAVIANAVDPAIPDSPTAKDKGHRQPSDIPMTMSRIFSDEVKRVSTRGVMCISRSDVVPIFRRSRCGVGLPSCESCRHAYHGSLRA